MKHIIVCADDYGLSPGVSKGIRELLAAGKITATSCITTTKFWCQEGMALQALNNKVASIGLHITLTDLEPLTAMPKFCKGGKMPSINALICRAYCKRLPLREIEVEVEAQLQAFIAVFGKLPAHIDGHQHVHILPGIREIILKIYKQYFPRQDVFIRSCCDSIANIVKRQEAIIKAALINFLGKKLCKILAQENIPTNDSFAGIYNFDLRSREYATVYANFLKAMPNKTLIMCHPGYVDNELVEIDKVTYQREQELAYFVNKPWAIPSSASKLSV